MSTDIQKEKNSRGLISRRRGGQLKLVYGIAKPTNDIFHIFAYAIPDAQNLHIRSLNRSDRGRQHLFEWREMCLLRDSHINNIIYLFGCMLVY